MPRQVAGRRGTVVRAARGSAPAAAMRERMGRRDTHGHVALVATISSDSALQSVMPQLVLAKDTALSAAERARLQALRAPMAWMEGAGGWVTGENFPAVLTAVRRALRVHRPHHHLVLILDCASQHLTDKVLAHAARLQLRLVFVPARVTHLIQPLDVNVFGLLKRRLQELQLERRSRDPAGRLLGSAWVDTMEEAVGEVLLRRPWGQAMAQNGATGTTAQLRPTLGEVLGGELPLELRPPTEDEMCRLVGRTRVRLAERLLRNAEGVRRRQAALPLGPPPLPPPELPPPPKAPPLSSIALRTRSRAPLPPLGRGSSSSRGVAPCRSDLQSGARILVPRT